MDITGMPVTYEAPPDYAEQTLGGHRSLEGLNEHVSAARYALEVCCGLASEMEVFPEFARLQGNQAFHARGLLPLSYHIGGARGALHMLSHGLNRHSVWVLLVSCLTNAERVAVDASSHLDRLRTAAADTAASDQVQAIERWFSTIPVYCEQALAMISRAFGADYARLQEAAREFNQRATETRRDWLRTGDAGLEERTQAPDGF